MTESRKSSEGPTKNKSPTKSLQDYPLTKLPRKTFQSMKYYSKEALKTGMKHVLASQKLIFGWAVFDIALTICIIYVVVAYPNLGRVGGSIFQPWFVILLLVIKPLLVILGVYGAHQRSTNLCRAYLVSLLFSGIVFVLFLIIMSSLSCHCEGRYDKEGNLERPSTGYYQCESLRDFSVRAGKPFVNFFPKPNSETKLPIDLLREQVLDSEKEKEDWGTKSTDMANKMKANQTIAKLKKFVSLRIDGKSLKSSSLGKKELGKKELSDERVIMWRERIYKHHGTDNTKLSSSQDKAIEELFQAMDEHVAGKIELTYVNEMLQALFKDRSPDDIQQVVQSADENQDGQVEKSQFHGVMEYFILGKTTVEPQDATPETATSDEATTTTTTKMLPFKIEGYDDSGFMGSSLLGNLQAVTKSRVRSRRIRAVATAPRQSQSLLGVKATVLMARYGRRSKSLHEANDTGVRNATVNGNPAPGKTDDGLDATARANAREKAKNKGYQYYKDLVGDQHAICLATPCESSQDRTVTNEDGSSQKLTEQQRGTFGGHCQRWSATSTRDWCLVREDSACHDVLEDQSLKEKHIQYHGDWNLKRRLTASTARCAYSTEKVLRRAAHADCKVLAIVGIIVLCIAILGNIWIILVVAKFVKQSCSDELQGVQSEFEPVLEDDAFSSDLWETSEDQFSDVEPEFSVSSDQSKSKKQGKEKKGEKDDGPISDQDVESSKKDAGMSKKGTKDDFEVDSDDLVEDLSESDEVSQKKKKKGKQR